MVICLAARYYDDENGMNHDFKVGVGRHSLHITNQVKTFLHLF
jgi:hypothetical protein